MPSENGKNLDDIEQISKVLEFILNPVQNKVK